MWSLTAGDHSLIQEECKAHTLPLFQADTLFEGLYWRQLPDPAGGLHLVRGEPPSIHHQVLHAVFSSAETPKQLRGIISVASLLLTLLACLFALNKACMLAFINQADTPAMQGWSNCNCKLVATAVRKHACVQASQLSETLSTCRFAQRMMQVTVDAQKNKGGMSSVHGNLFKLDPVMQQYLEVSHKKCNHDSGITCCTTESWQLCIWGNLC